MVALNKTYLKTLTPDRSAKDSGLRFYSAEISRWPSRDPIGENGGLNLYGFVGNGPIHRIDPLGKEGCDTENSGTTTPSSSSSSSDITVTPSGGDAFGCALSTRQRTFETQSVDGYHLYVWLPFVSGKSEWWAEKLEDDGKDCDKCACAGASSSTLARKDGPSTDNGFDMRMDAAVCKFEGCCKDLEILWYTCARTTADGLVKGPITSCFGKTTCFAEAKTSGRDQVFTHARLRWLACEDGKWTTKRSPKDGYAQTYTIDGGKWSP